MRTNSLKCDGRFYYTMLGGTKRSPWSARTQWDMGETPWASELARLRAAGARLWDLTASNPTACGFPYDDDTILRPLSRPEALQYEPNPKGLRSAREAVSGYYRDHGASVDLEQVFLTTS